MNLKDLRPINVDDLIRLGNEFDGGYVVPESAVRTSNCLLSFGICDDWSFERDFLKLNQNIVAHCYDHTTLDLISFKKIMKALRGFIRGSRKKSSETIKLYLSYKSFFRKNVVHFSKRVWNEDDDISDSIPTIFKKVEGCDRAFVKMDIEGGEYLVTKDILSYHEMITGMTIEFHDLDVRNEEFDNIIGKMKENFYIVHVHANNYGGRGPDDRPKVLEITFLNKNLIKSKIKYTDRKYPLIGLDRPNNPLEPDIRLDF